MRQRFSRFLWPWLEELDERIEAMEDQLSNLRSEEQQLSTDVGQVVPLVQQLQGQVTALQQQVGQTAPDLSGDVASIKASVDALAGVLPQQAPAPATPPTDTGATS